MKKIKTACLALLFICSSALMPTAQAGSLDKKVIWIFYNAGYDMTIYYNPGADDVTNIEWPGHDVSGIDDSHAATYFPVDGVLYLSDFQIYVDGNWEGISGAFEKQ